MATDQTKHALQEKLDEQQLLRDNDSGLRSVFVQVGVI